MPDNVEQVVAPQATPTSGAEAVQAPVVEAVVDTPVVETAITEAPKPSSSEAAQPAKTGESTLLGDETKVEAPVEEAPKVEEKSADEVVKEATKEGEENKEEIKDEGGQSEETAPPPVFEAFTLPEGLSADGERVGVFTNLLGELETKTKADHSLLQEFGQKLVDYHVDELKTAQETWVKVAQETWENQKKSWKDEFLADPTLGGGQFQSTVDAALTFIRTHGGTAEEQKELRDALESSGLGNHKAFIRTFANAGKAMSEGKPLAAQKPAAAPKSRVSTMYGRNS